VGRGCACDEELRAVGVGASIGLGVVGLGGKRGRDMGCGVPWREGRAGYAWQGRLHPQTFRHRWIRHRFLHYAQDQVNMSHDAKRRNQTVALGEITGLDHESGDAGMLRLKSRSSLRVRVRAYFLMTR
jgi:hypothetical protein